MSVNNVNTQQTHAHSHVDTAGELTGTDGTSNSPNGLLAGLDGVTNSLFTEGLSVLYANMEIVQDQANDQFQEMHVRQQDARVTHEMSERVGNLMKQMGSNPKTTTELPPDIVKYMQQANMTVAGMPINEYLKKYKKKLNSGQLGDIQAALDAKNSEDTDFAAQQQLVIQQQIQKYNNIVQYINAMQTMLSELNKNIASNIR